MLFAQQDTKMKNDLMAAIMEALKQEKDLGLSDEEMKFISYIVGGYVFSPPSVRLALVPKFKSIVKEAIDMIRQRQGSPGNKGGADEQWN
jgi:hypothetical protein